LLFLAAPAWATVDLDWITVGDPGNADDDTGFGAVAHEYRIGRYEVTNAQYAEFLNAVAATDPNGLYNTSMGSGFGSITRSGSSGSFTYAAVPGREDMPVNYVSFWDATRFANWLHNGQPTGAQDDTTTEDGAYTLTTTDITNNTVTRNEGAAAFVTSEDEWYKAAYYDPGTTSYFDYPAGSDAQTVCAVPGATANTANCSSVNGDVTDVGSYTGAASPNGTFDQGGNTWEWNEAIISGTFRGMRGGGFADGPGPIAASFRGALNPAGEVSGVGFRVLSPVPPFPQGIPAIGPMGLALLGGLLGAAVLASCRITRPRD
jgi:formylglycine-generating enzyme required for sulfatase activity